MSERLRKEVEREREVREDELKSEKRSRKITRG